MRINKKTVTVTFANLFILGWGASTSLFADSFDDTVNTLKKQGYDVNVEIKGLFPYFFIQKSLYINF